MTLSEPTGKDPAALAYAREVNEAIRAGTPRPSSGVLVSGGVGGTTFKVVRRIGPMAASARRGGRPTLYVYATAALEVKVSAGLIIDFWAGARGTIAESAAIAIPANSTAHKIWLQRTAAGVWSIGNDASAYPTTVSYIALAEVVSDSTKITAINRAWHGNLVLNGLFAVGVTKDGGDAGSPSATCSFTYTLKVGALTLVTTKTPARPRFTNTEYNQPATNSLGLAYIDGAGALQLYEAVEEVPKTDLVQLQTQYRVDGANKKFQVKYRNVRVLEAEDEDAAWTDVHTGTVCP